MIRDVSPADVRFAPPASKRLRNESMADWNERRLRFQSDLKKDNDPLVYAQEYLAQFVDWAGVAFFSREKLLQDGQPLPHPNRCDGVFAVLDTASKTGTERPTPPPSRSLPKITSVRSCSLSWTGTQPRSRAPC